MAEHRPSKTDQEIVTAFESLINAAFEALFDEPPSSEAGEEINQFLREIGYDPGELESRMTALALLALRTSPLNWRNQARAARAESQARAEAVRARIPQGRDALIAMARQLLGQSPAPVAAHFRNYESMDEEDLASLVGDLLLLDEDARSGQGEEDLL